MIKNYYKFVLPVKPDSINKVIKYGKKEGDIVSLKRKWEKIAIGYIRRAIDDHQLPEKFHGKVGMHFKLYFETQRERDGDNYNAMCKGIIDAFVVERMIVDDSQQFIDDNGRRLKIDKDRSRVDVYITETIEDKDIVSIDYGITNKNDNLCTRSRTPEGIKKDTKHPEMAYRTSANTHASKSSKAVKE